MKASSDVVGVAIDHEKAVADANYFREWAQRCRALAQIASQAEVMYQLQVWAMEFDRDADEAEGLSVEPEDPGAPRRS